MEKVTKVFDRVDAGTTKRALWNQSSGHSLEKTLVVIFERARRNDECGSDSLQKRPAIQVATDRVDFR